MPKQFSEENIVESFQSLVKSIIVGLVAFFLDVLKQGGSVNYELLGVIILMIVMSTAGKVVMEYLHPSR